MKGPVRHQRRRSEGGEKVRIARVVRDQVIPDADLQDPQHPEHVDVRVVVHTRKRGPVKHQDKQRKPAEPEAHDRGQVRKGLPGLQPRFPEQQNQSRGQTQHHPDVDREEYRSMRVGTGLHGKGGKVDLRPVHQEMQVVGQGEQGEQNRWDQQQGLVPSSRPVPPVDAQAGHQEQRGDQSHRPEIQIAKVSYSRRFRRAAVSEHPQQLVQKQQRRRSDHPVFRPGGQQPRPDRLEPVEQETHINQIIAASAKHLQHRDPGAGKQIHHPRQQEKHRKKIGAAHSRPVIHRCFLLWAG